MKKLVKLVQNVFSSQSREKSRSQKSSFLRLESLESRELLAASSLVAEATQSALVAAINEVDAGGTVYFAEELAGQTIELDGEAIQIKKDVTIDAENLNITIDAGGESRVFYIDAQVAVALNGLTLTGGTSWLAPHNSGNGGAIFNRYADLTVTNCTIVGNESRDGGGIFNCHGTLTVVDSTITDNNATRYAGGLYNFGPTASIAIVNSIVAGNVETTDADVYIREGEVSAYYSQISGVRGEFTQSVGTDTEADATGIFVYDEESGALVLENGVAVIAEDGDATNVGTLVGQLNGDWYYVDKAAGAWRMVGAEAATEMAFDAEAEDFGLIDGAIIATAQNVTAAGVAFSRVDGAAWLSFDVGAYAAAYSAPFEVILSTTTPGYYETVYVSTDPALAKIGATYRWYYVNEDLTEVEVEVPVATDGYFKVKDEAVGKALKVVVTGVGEYAGSVSAMTEVIANPEIKSVRLSRTAPGYNNVVTASVTPSLAGATATYQWYRVAADEMEIEIEGATSADYTITSVDDIGCKLKVVATGTGIFVGSASATTEFAVTAMPILSVELTNYAPVVGDTISIVQLPSDATCTYQWYRVDPETQSKTRIDGAVYASYEATEADLGYELKAYAFGQGTYRGSKAAQTSAVDAALTDIFADEDELVVEF